MPDTPKLDELLSHRDLGRVFPPDGIGAEFALIRRAWELSGKKMPVASEFADVGRGSGTHLLKLVSPRAPAEQGVLRVVANGTNRQPNLIPSVDAKLASVGKLVFRPLEIEGYPSKSLADHLLNPDELSPVVTKGFADAFSQEALDALRDGLQEGPPTVTKLPAAEFPIVFLPRPGGGDLQATPLAPAEAYVRMEEVTAPYFQKRVDGQLPPQRGVWHRQHVSSKPQNISSAVGKRRTRFLARMPRVLARWDAELHRYAHGGRFPRWQGSEVAQAVSRYADLLDRSRDYSNRDIRHGLDWRADALIRAARDFIDETHVDARAEHPEAMLSDPPSIVAILLRLPWPTQDDRDRARRVLTGTHFKERLAKAGEV